MSSVIRLSSLSVSLFLSLRDFSSYQTGFLATLSFQRRKCAVPSAKLFFMGAEKKKGMKGENTREDTSCDSKRDFAASGIFVGKNVTSGKKRIDKRR